MGEYKKIETFTSVMIEHVFELRGPGTVITLNLPGLGPVHVSEHYISEGKRHPHPGNDVELLKYYRTKLLINSLGSYHLTGTLILNGNAGTSIASYARGGKIVLNGECGLNGCFGLGEGGDSDLEHAIVEINGIAGHYLLGGARHGKVYVNDGLVDEQHVTGNIRSIGFSYRREKYFNFNPPGLTREIAEENVKAGKPPWYPLDEKDLWINKIVPEIECYLRGKRIYPIYPKDRPHGAYSFDPPEDLKDLIK
jgi:hypothetical protein